MSPLKSPILLTASVALIALSGSVQAQSVPKNYGYWNDGSGSIVKSGYGLCWRSGYWTSALAVVECDPDLVPKPPPPPPPPPPPAPIVEAPPPPPPPPPPPQETFRTEVIEKEVRLEGANFATGSSRLLPAAYPQLDAVASEAMTHPEINFAITGYTDSAGSAHTNLTLSHARADAVKNYLVGKGISAERISAAGLGEENPIASNKTAAGRAQNRRVEIRYIHKEETKVRVPPQ